MASAGAAGHRLQRGGALRLAELREERDQRRRGGGIVAAREERDDGGAEVGALEQPGEDGSRIRRRRMRLSRSKAARRAGSGVSGVGERLARCGRAWRWSPKSAESSSRDRRLAKRACSLRPVFRRGERWLRSSRQRRGAAACAGASLAGRCRICRDEQIAPGGLGRGVPADGVGEARQRRLVGERQAARRNPRARPGEPEPDHLRQEAVGGIFAMRGERGADVPAAPPAAGSGSAEASASRTVGEGSFAASCASVSAARAVPPSVARRTAQRAHARHPDARSARRAASVIERADGVQRPEAAQKHGRIAATRGELA